MDMTAESVIRECCTNFIIELVKQLKQRLPDNFEILRQTDIFAVENVLKFKQPHIVAILEFFKISKIADVERQYADVRLCTWQNTENTLAFWLEVLAYRDSAGNQRFYELASVAVQILSLPWSNADVERVFSQVNLVKSKLRNGMNLNTLNSILSVRYGLNRNDKCCYEYTLPPK
ncbi:uncharacterized protein LOC116804664 isoform X1 [Drosophila mojavensis]|uniref:uncharacterized protein LOC116804664 isoform X1 n=1 Tax=Drosophila mojavensis TaxID=7230 RepID=UPI001CD1564B|nr:uncharacterized protein LOC116804664 isoform X1 [Drosophila mojavensis]